MKFLSQLCFALALSLPGFAQADDQEERKRGGLGESKRDPEIQTRILLKECDKDGDGALTHAEFKRSEIYRRIKVKEGEGDADRAFGHADNNKDGELSESELERSNLFRYDPDVNRQAAPRRGGKGGVKGK